MSRATSDEASDRFVDDGIAGFRLGSPLAHTTDEEYDDVPASGPALVMPRVALPSRRQFTANGLRLGKLKILVAGDSGVGKSELVRALTDVCPDVVYADDAQAVRWVGDGSIAEMQASSKPCPLYCLPQPELEGSTATAGSGSRRSSVMASLTAQSADESALDRNICLVDAPGYGASEDAAAAMDTVEAYLEEGFRAAAGVVNTRNPAVAVGVLTNATSLSEFSHVDACLYMVLNRVKQVDIEYMRRISAYAPVIPVIAKADQLGPRDVLQLKVDILREMRHNDIRPFLFGVEIDEAVQWCEAELRRLSSAPNGEPERGSVVVVHGQDDRDADDNNDEPTPGLLPCAVSCLRNMDADMVASVVMAPDYYPPPVESELRFLCRYLFSEHGAAWIRYAAAHKFAEWAAAKQTSTALVAAGPTAIVSQGTHGAAGHRIEVVLPQFMEMPSAVLGERDRASQQTARWAMQMEHESRSEKALVRFSRGRRGTRQSSPDTNAATTGTTATTTASGARSPQRELPYSVANLDPLGLASLLGTFVTYAAEALVVAVGIRLAAGCFWPRSGPSPEPPQPSRPEPLLAQFLRALRAKWAILLS